MRSWQFISAHVLDKKFLPQHVLVLFIGSSSHENNNNMPRTKSSIQERSSHSLEATLFGVICNSCATKVIERGNGLLPPSAKVIRAHWNKWGCSVGSPAAGTIAKTLKEDMKKIRHRSDQETVAKVAADHFPPDSTEKDAYVCKDCLFHSKQYTDFKKHFNTGRSPGLGCRETSQSLSDQIKIIVGKYGIALPKDILSYMMDRRYCWEKEGEKDESDCDWMLRWCLPTSPPHFCKQSPASTAGSAVPVVSPPSTHIPRNAAQCEEVRHQSLGGGRPRMRISVRGYGSPGTR